MSESTALATTNYDASTYSIEALYGEGNVPKPETIELIQPINADEGLAAGIFRAKTSNFQLKNISLIALQFDDGRVYWPDKEALGSKPLCRSNDGKNPVRDNVDLVPQCASGCKNCELGQWKKVKKGDRLVNIKPPCVETMRFLFVEESTGFPYRMNAKGTALPPIRALKDTMFKVVMMTKAKGNLIPHFGFVIDMSSTKIVGPKGTYFIPKFSAPRPIESKETYKMALDRYNSLVLRRGADVEDDDPQAVVDQAINRDTAPEQYYVEG